MRRFGVPPGGPYDRASAALAGRLPGAVCVWEFALPCRFRVESAGMVGLQGALRGPGNGCWAVEAGDILEFGPARRGLFSYLAASPQTSAPVWWPSSPSLAREPIRFLPGPDAAQFDLEGFCATAWVATLDHSRVGLRLEGLPLLFDPLERHSEPQVVGTIQVPPNGKPVILGPDGPTVGGYAKLGVIIDADLDRVAQLASGDPVGFQIIS